MLDIDPSFGIESSVAPVAWVESCFLGPGEGERQSMLAGLGVGKKLDGGGGGGVGGGRGA